MDKEIYKKIYEYRAIIDCRKKRNNADIYYNEYRSKLIYNLLSEYSTDKIIVDIGCGDGGITLPLVKISSEFYGLDISKFNIKRAKTNSKMLKMDNVFYKVIYGSDLEFNDNSIDIVVMTEVIEHIEKSESLVLYKEVNRILKRGGYLLIGTPIKYNIIGKFIYLFIIFLLTIAYPFWLKESFVKRFKKNSINCIFSDDDKYLTDKEKQRLAVLARKVNFVEHVNEFKRKKLINQLNEMGYLLKAKSGTPPCIAHLINYYEKAPYILKIYKKIFEPIESNFLSRYGTQIYMVFKKK